MDMFSLKDRVALVTGGNGGIGLGMARGLARAGAAIVLQAATRARPSARWRTCRRSARKARSSSSTSPTKPACRAWSQRAVEKFGRLDILVNNAGIMIRKPPHDFRARMACSDRHESDRRLLRSQAAYPHDEAAGRRQDHQYRLDDVHLRRALCGGLCGLEGRHRATLAVAGDRLGAHHIQVNAILPGWIDTTLTRAAGSRCRDCMSGCWHACPPAAGASRAISPGSRSSWRARRPISSRRRHPVNDGTRIAAWFSSHSWWSRLSYSTVHLTIHRIDQRHRRRIATSAAATRCSPGRKSVWRRPVILLQRINELSRRLLRRISSECGLPATPDGFRRPPPSPAPLLSGRKRRETAKPRKGSLECCVRLV